MIIEKDKENTTIVMSNADAQMLRDILGCSSYSTANNLADGDEEGAKLIDNYLSKMFQVLTSKFPNSNFDF